MALVTPAQSGEMSKVELLKKRGLMERFSGYSSFLLERYVDFCLIVAVAIFGLSGGRPGNPILLHPDGSIGRRSFSDLEDRAGERSQHTESGGNKVIPLESR